MGHGLVWRKPTVTDYRHRLQRILYEWHGTPYRAGWQLKKVGTDCVRFTCGVLDELCHREATEIETLPFDASLHDREGAIRGMLAIRQRFRPNEQVKDEFIEPGDILVVGPKGSPGHAMLVGCQPHHYWHASSIARQVVRSGEDYFHLQEVFAVIRYGMREGWRHE